MNLITLDFETYYDQQYSLSKLTIEEYIRDPRFECIGFSIKINSGMSVWFSDTHKHLCDILLEHELHKHAVLSHHAHFDMAILNWIFGIRPKVILDTLSMARAVYGASAGNSLAKLAERLGLGVKGDEVIKALGKRRLDFTTEELYKYGQYCRNDVDLTYAAFLKLKSHINNNELKIIDQTVRMFTEPALRVDVPLLEEHLTKVKQRKSSLLESCGVDKKDLMSNEKFAGLLRGFGIEPPIKVSATTGKEAYAFAKTDEGFKALLEHEDERVQALAAARVGNKSTLEETRTQRFIDIGRRGLIPVPLNYCGAHTSRWSGCLVADTSVIVYNVTNGIEVKRIIDVLLDDYVWDGEEFVQHEGISFSGFAEVIEWDGVRGTEDHVVYTDAGEISLRDAMQGGYNIKTMREPTTHDVDALRQRLNKIWR